MTRMHLRSFPASHMYRTIFHPNYDAFITSLTNVCVATPPYYLCANEENGHEVIHIKWLLQDVRLTIQCEGWKEALNRSVKWLSAYGRRIRRRMQ